MISNISNFFKVGNRPILKIKKMRNAMLTKGMGVIKNKMTHSCHKKSFDLNILYPHISFFFFIIVDEIRNIDKYASCMVYELAYFK
mgnify:CR=1 FL=1